MYYICYYLTAFPNSELVTSTYVLLMVRGGGMFAQRNKRYNKSSKRNRIDNESEEEREEHICSLGRNLQHMRGLK